MRPNHIALNRKIILITALTILDESGIEALSMRTLAKHLNVKAMSLYNHIKNKEDLLNGVVEIILQEVLIPEPTSDWKKDLRRIACSFHATLLRHPNVIPIISTHSPVTAKGLEQAEKILSILNGINKAGLCAFSLMHIIVAYIIGHAGMSLTSQQENKKSNEKQFYQDEENLKTLPNLLNAFQNLSQRNIDEEFMYGLNLILDSL